MAEEEVELEFLGGAEDVDTAAPLSEKFVQRVEEAVASGRTAHNLAPMRRGLNFWEWVCAELVAGNTLLIQRGNTIREIKIRM